MTSRPGSDTTPEVLALQVAAWRRMTPSARVELAWEMSEAARGLLLARLRSEHPDWTAGEVRAELVRLALQGAGSNPQRP
jgi:hypothetical protein